MGNLVLMGERIYLQNIIERVEPEELQRTINCSDQIRYLHPVPYPYTLKDAQDYINYLKSIKDDTIIEFGIFHKDTHEFIGVMCLENINYSHQNCEIGYWIKKERWKQGYAKEGANLAIKFAFEKLDLIRIYALLQKENTASLSLLTSLGFQVEGLMRKSAKNKGVLIDRYICSLLRE